MNVAARDIESTPIPMENGTAVRAKVTTLPDGSWSLAFAFDGGLRVEPFGPSFDKVRDACRAAAALNARAGA